MNSGKPARRVLLLPCVCLLCVSAAAQDNPRSFYADRRAHAPGEMLTVLVTEFSTVSASAQTTTNKSESARVSVLDKTGTVKPLAADYDGKSAGGGEIQRSDTLVAKLAVTVESVDAHGNLTI